MHTPQLNRALLAHIEKQGFQARIVSIAHLKELQKEIETLHQNGMLDKEL